MTVSRLLKSCATPPARRPTDSIFWACISRASAFSRSVISRVTPSTSRLRPCSSGKRVVTTSVLYDRAIPARLIHDVRLPARTLVAGRQARQPFPHECG